MFLGREAVGESTVNTVKTSKLWGEQRGKSVSSIPGRAAPWQTLGVRSSSALSRGISSHSFSFVNFSESQPKGDLSLCCCCGS